MHLLQDNPHEIRWNNLSKNPSAIHLLEKPENRDKIDWFSLNTNPKAVHLLEANPEKIRITLCKNPNPDAINLLERELLLYPRMNLEWAYLSANPSAIHIIENSKEENAIVERYNEEINRHLRALTKNFQKPLAM